MRLEQILNIDEGITHLEDLAVDEFINAMRNFGQYEISEKVDGSNLQFGLDDEGFYTSREAKGAGRIRSEADYGISFPSTFMRSAHLALEKVLPIMVNEGGLKKGDRVEVEVLYGELPNAIRYTSEENRIIFLRTVDGTADIDLLRSALDGRKVAVELTVPFTVDGKSIKTGEEINLWSFEQTPTVSGDTVTKTQAMQNLQKEVDAMEAYLLQDAGIGNFSNAELLALPLNKRPEGVEPSEWKDLKEKVKTKKAEIQKKLYHEEDGERVGFKARIKDILLNELVRKVKSAFGPEIEDGGWIEGVVFRHKDTGEMFKVVDKDMFTTVNKFNYKVRSELSEKPRSVQNIESFVGELLVGMASALGHPELGTTQAKRYLRKQGETPEEIVTSLSKDVNFNSVRQYWVNFINQKEKDLVDKLSEYQKTKGEHEIEINLGSQKRKFYYDEEIDKRTLQVFASLFDMMENFKKQIKTAKSPEDLIMMMSGRQIGEL